MLDLPSSPTTFADARWEDLAPYYECLATAPLTRDTADEWLATWSRLQELVVEAGTMAMVAYTGNTADQRAEDAYLRFSADIFPRVDEQEVRLARRLLDLGYDRADMLVTVREFRTDAAIFRPENVPLLSQVEELAAAYQKVTGGMTVEWDGERKTLPQLQPYLQSPDRDERERAFRLGARAYLDARDTLADQFDRMYALRTEVARNAGFPDFQAYCFAAKHRFDYSRDDVGRFHRAVEECVVPAVERVLAIRRNRLGLSTVRPWDLQVDPEGAPPLRPFDDVETFVLVAERVFGAVDPELGEYFRTMAREELLDLESREGKAPGGYCTRLPFRRRPFIFMNAVGVADDVNTLVHEAGHCFHAFLASALPFLWQRGTGSEASELASMGMELLAAPHLGAPEGYYTADELRRAQAEHLEDILFSLAHIASVDAFQRWIYTSGDGGDRDARDRAWLEIRARFEPGVDWTGLDAERVARWYRQLHIFELPFYYIEYGIAQLGALQIWRRSLADPADAVARYKAALALGNTRPLPDIYAAAGASLVFDTAEMAELVSLVEQRIEVLRGVRAVP
ncbi:MAG TPA: M3 family oligoendopeptidase [Gemmatimonadaceae bacterium]|nr:M3 family oligoendopeptidase [Gemmatimonadaceae bacterium]